MTRPVHQLIIGAGPGDAITAMALGLRDELRRRRPSEIYARFIAPELAGEVRPMDQLAGGGGLLLYHASFGVPEVTSYLLRCRHRLALVYHNVTPASMFIDVDPAFAAGLHWGRHELELLRPRVSFAVAVSEFNRRDLEALGYEDVTVVPVGLHPRRLHGTAPDSWTAHQVAERFPRGYALTVSQVLPHKRVEAVLHAVHVLRWVHDLDIGLVVAGHHRFPAYADALRSHAHQIGVQRLWMTGSVSDEVLAALYRGASVHLTASAHEGLALPPLEAMSFGVPVVAVGNGALPETIGDAGLIVPPDRGPIHLAEAVAAIVADTRLRRELVRRGRERVDEIERHRPTARFVRMLDERAPDPDGSSLDERAVAR